MKTLLSIIAFMLVTALGPATQVAIKGTVTDGSGNPLSGVVVMVKGTNITAMTGVDGTYAITISQEAKILLFSLRGMKPLEELISGRTLINVTMEPDNTADIERKPDDPVIPDKDKEEKRVDEVLYYVVEEDVICESADAAVYDRHVAAPAGAQMKSAYYRHPHPVPQNTESYTGISENGYRDPLQEPYSTFSIDVDNASYSNVRRFINLGQEVPADAVRIEEMINYFRYDYPQPSGEHPFSVYTEAGICPWNNNHYLLHIGLRGEGYRP